ncbi:site-specific integrase [Pseudomonas alloputida]|uniref:tyrosine-type recombinase/integrase n=1 Tax=Pseudomonas alloputida TaxID=1940621 RepID=UPI0032EE40DD
MSDRTFEIVETFRQGKRTYRLICADAALASFFDDWAMGLANQKQFNTVKAYSNGVKVLLIFVYEFGFQRGGLTAEVLAEALGSFENYLVFGKASSDKTVSAVAKVIGERNLGSASVALYITAANNYIEASETYRLSLKEFVKAGYVDEVLVSSIPITATEYARPLPGARAALKANSWLAGCIQGGARKIRRARLLSASTRPEVVYTDEFGGDDTIFPIDKCAELIASAPCLRDKLLWSVLAATGCRISEALTLLVGDVRIGEKSKKVFIFDPKGRVDMLSRFMTDKQIARLSHKGRKTPDTYLIEPFASTFWRTLDEYVAEQRALEAARHSPVNHHFLFRNLEDGSPIVSSYQAVWERFNAAAKKLTGRSYGFHSLRHMYGYYLANHCPNPFRPSTFGFELSFIRDAMGHASTRTTAKYAKKDGAMLEAAMSAMNLLRIRDSEFSVLNVQIRHLQQQIDYLTDKMRKLK